MNKSVIQDLYYGRFSAWERRPNRTAESIVIDKKIEEEKRYFIQKMSLDDCERFQKLEALYMQLNEFEQIDAFAYGVKFGIMFMCDIFMGDQENFPTCNEE